MLKAFLLLIIFLLACFLYGLIKIRFFPPSIPEKVCHDPGAGETPPLVRHVWELSRRIGSRSVYEYEKLEAAKDYIIGTAGSWGFDPEVQRYEYDGRVYANIVVTLPGREKADSWVVVGAHYDTVAGTPGADDNGSAVAVLLEMVRSLRERSFDRTVKFVFFTLEEPPVFRSEFMGSAVFAREARDRGQDIEAMICLEMLGFFGDEKGKQSFPFPLMNLFYSSTPNFIAVVGNLKSRKLIRAVADVLRKNSPVPVETLWAPSLVPGIDFSDHRSFWKMGYPAVMITDTAFYRNPFYHTSRDTLETLDPRRMGELLPGLVALVRDLAGGE